MTDNVMLSESEWKENTLGKDRKVGIIQSINNALFSINILLMCV